MPNQVTVAAHRNTVRQLVRCSKFRRSCGDCKRGQWGEHTERRNDKRYASWWFCGRAEGRCRFKAPNRG